MIIMLCFDLFPHGEVNIGHDEKRTSSGKCVGNKVAINVSWELLHGNNNEM